MAEFGQERNMDANLHTEELTHIEFSEYTADASEAKKPKHKQWGGLDDDKGADDYDYDNDTDSDDKRKHKKKSQWGGNSDEAKKRKNTHPKQRDNQWGGLVDDDSSSDDKDEINIDYLFTEEKHKPTHKPIKHTQTGGASEIENDFYSIFKTAKEYSKRLENLEMERNDRHKNKLSESMDGGYFTANLEDNTDDDTASDDTDDNADEDQMGGKREMPPKVMAMIEIAKKLKPTNPQIKWTKLVGIAKLIWEAATKQSGSADIDAIKERAMILAKNPAKYIQEYTPPAPKPKKAKRAKKGAAESATKSHTRARSVERADRRGTKSHTKTRSRSRSASRDRMHGKYY